LFKFSNKGYYPIHVAAIYDRPEIIDELIDKGANIEAETNDKETPLIIASRKGKVNAMLSLLNRGANLYAVDCRRWSSLHYAAFNLYPKAV